MKHRNGINHRVREKQKKDEKKPLDGITGKSGGILTSMVQLLTLAVHASLIGIDIFVLFAHTSQREQGELLLRKH